MGLLAVVALMCPWPEASSSPVPSARLEFTGADLLSRRDWTSTDIEVAGLFLGMSRAEASEAAHSRGFVLLQSAPPYYHFAPCSDYPECFISSTPNKADDVSVSFGKRNEIIQIDLDVRGPELEGKVLRGLIGRTYQFFNAPYTERHRIELFGQETRSEQVQGGYSPKANDTRYFYDKRGITITISPNPMTAPLPDLAGMSFVPPAMHR